MNKHAAVLLPLLFLAACGSYKAVRPSVQTPVVAESQTYSVNYKAAKGQRITAVYINGSSPMTVELRQGNTVEKLKQVRSWAKGVEYSNISTRWHVQEGFATLKRKNKQTVFTEIIE